VSGFHLISTLPPSSSQCTEAGLGMFGSATGGDGGAQAEMTANVTSIDVTIQNSLRHFAS